MNGDELRMSAKERERLLVMGQVESGALTLAEGAEAMGVSYRQAKRIGKGYRARGAAGAGVHPFQESAFVTQVFDSLTSVAHTFIVANNRPAAMALELDYTGYPVVDLKGAERFYTNVMDLGEPYTDQGYRGY